MLNYIAAELYKFRFHRGLYIGTGLLLLLELLVFLPGIAVRGQGKDYIPRDVLLTFLLVAMTVGVLIAPIFAAMAFDNQHGNGTLKNEVVFGVPRGRSYLGKMLAGAIAGTGIALLAIGFYLALTALLGGESRELVQWDWYLRDVLTQWLAWLTFYAAAFLMLALFAAPAVAIAFIYMAATILPVVTAVIWDSSLSFGWQLAASLSFGAPAALLIEGGDATSGVILPLLGGNVLLYALLLCLLWWGISAGTGVLILRQRDIK